MELEGQMSFLDIGKTPLKINKPIRLIELFAGIGAQAKALERLGADFEHYRVVEFDKYAIRSYNAIHGTNFETMDIRDVHASDLGIVDKDRYCYVMTYSFPCTDLSLAGHQKGYAKGGQTRSGLLWEVERILRQCTELPDVLLMENVTQVHGKKFADDWGEWVRVLSELGYTSQYADLNAKHYGIPQNPIPLTRCLKDCLDKEVDDKYYLSDETVGKLLRHLDARGWQRLEDAIDNEAIWNSVTEEYMSSE